MIRVGLNVHPDDDFRALLPLVLAEDAVDALEWSWELGTPEWLMPLCDLFAAHDALSVHLVQYPLNGDDARAESLLQRVRRECAARPPRLLSAHFGVIAARGFRAIAPVPVVPSRTAAYEARERLARLRDAAACPVGIENLGIAFSADDVRRQAEMVHTILEGDAEHFLLLDVHNLYCQAENYGLSMHEMLSLYPLERVREVHVSGGSWWEAAEISARFRRDTHDQAVPDAVLAFLSTALAHAPAVEQVTFERMGATMPQEADREEARIDYRRVVETVRAARRPSELVPTAPRALPELPHATPRAFEAALIAALCDAEATSEVRERVAQAHPEYGAWLDAIDERALRVAMTFERRWARRA